MDKLQLNGLQFYGRHGTEVWEKEVGRRFEVDLELELDMTRCGKTDRLRYALDYRKVYAMAKDVVEGESHDLIERIVWRLLEEVFARFAPVSAVRVRVHKPEAPIGGINCAVVAEIYRTREEFKSSSFKDEGFFPTE